MRAIFKYPGSKWSINQWIIDHFPEHHSYLEPFFGSGGVFFKKKRSPIETINDLDHDVVNFFQQCVKDPERLAREIYLMPYAREIYEKAISEMRSGGGYSGKRHTPGSHVRSQAHDGIRLPDKRVQGWMETGYPGPGGRLCCQ